MAKYKEDFLVQCPYYKDEDTQFLHCEGVEDGTGLQLGFHNRKKMRDYKDRFCRGCWKTCRLAGMLNRKYDYEP